jgi:hypothetical protein
MLTPRSLGTALGIVVVFGCGDGVGSKTDACQSLDDCCESMEGQERELCNMAHDAAARSGTPRMSCEALVDSYRDSGLCGGDGDGAQDEGSETPQSGDSDGDGDGDGSPHAVCDEYLHCAGTSSPGSLPSLLSTYGPDGTCWSSGASVEATCIEACTNGLADLEESGLCGDTVDDSLEDEDDGISIPTDEDEVDPIDEFVYDYCAKVESCFSGQIDDCFAIGDQLRMTDGACRTAIETFMVCTIDAFECQDVASCPDPNPACQGQ